MKIGDKENVNEITLRYKGRDIKFECFIKPFPYAERLDLKEKDPVEIVFDDKTTLKFITVIKNGEVKHIGKSIIRQPEVKFGGGSIKWFDDKQLVKK